MKSVRFSLINKKFDDQYTFDLQGYLSVQDFCSSFNLLNQSVFKNPPPGNKLVWVIAIWILWMIAIISNYLLWIFTKSSHGLVILPFFMILTTLLCIWRHRVLRQRFELSILSICNRINATENIRGINYRFSKNGSDLSDLSKQVSIVSNSNLKTIYSILIEFDDRYNALSSQQFNRYPSVDFVTVPLYAHVNEKPTTAWTSTKQYDEKFITHQ
ncbi:hypothetical protein EDC94DRAFT_625258 [Helicostylum pulchrum]|uniref:Uncharacterized protein n=1 Tax=Helicostylum pulchrum TaxID=562976 RepID=A0ABP9YBL8_9FUNG|nr:hypothetical protein EDC94DRAFT_625258 [Helicostylum pulchrum]